MNKYTVLLTILRYGSEAIPCEQDKVKEQCIRLKALSKIVEGEAYLRIEVINNETGEIREFWNNRQDKNLF